MPDEVAVDDHQWVKIDPGELSLGGVTTVVAGGRALAVSRTEAGLGVLDNRCPHQGGPLGDGGFGQYMAEFTTAVKYRMPITHVLLNNDELGKISREQIGAIRPVYETSLVNPDFAEYARLCGGAGFRVETREQLEPALQAALETDDGPALVEVSTSARAV